MQKPTKKAFNALLTAMALQYSIDSVAETFNVDPAEAQKIILATKEENSFLDRINIVQVKNQKGNAIRVNATGMIAGTTNTDSNDRTPKDPHSMGGSPYLCEQINFDTSIKYATLDSWAHKKNFKKLVAQQIRKQIAANKITIGFYGESRVADSNPITSPKGQDIAEGWLHKVKTLAPENYITQGSVVNQIRIGETGDYANLDVAVHDIKGLIEPEFEGDGDLVVIIGTELLSSDKAKFYDSHGNTPSEKARIEDKQVIGTYGGLSAFKIPHFPVRGILVTSFNNLSIYIQQDGTRRRIEDNPKRDRIETFQSENMDYVIEELGKIATLEFANVKLTHNNGTTWS